MEGDGCVDWIHTDPQYGLFKIRRLRRKVIWKKVKHNSSRNKLFEVFNCVQFAQRGYLWTVINMC